jgi:hypothetical protein
VEGQDFDTSKLGSVDKKVIKLVPKIGLLKMALRLKQQPATKGWLYFTEGVGNFGTDYVLRGMANLLGPGWNRPQNAVYPISQKDAEGYGKKAGRGTTALRPIFTAFRWWSWI